MQRVLLLLLIALTLLAEAQESSGNGGSNAFGSQTLLCNGSFADANATGMVSYNPNVFQGKQDQQPDNDSGLTLPITFAATVAENSNSTTVQLSTWLNTGGANYSDDFGLGYDVCAFALDPLPYNDILRGQNDNGSCYEMFDQSCVGAINTAAQEYAEELTVNPSPQPNSNLTSTSLPTVCDSIATMLTNTKPKECSNYFQDNTTFSTPTALTSYNSSGLYGDCYTNGTGLDDSGTFWLIQTRSVAATEQNYDDAVHSVGAILTVWLPIANANRPSTILDATAEMTCFRPSNVTRGSRVPAALPAAKSVGGGGLSGGAIAGIVIGVLVGVALIGGLAAWWFLKRRKAAKVDGTVEKNVDTLNAAPGDIGSVQSPETAELSPEWRRPELDAGKDTAKYELLGQTGGKDDAKEILSNGKSDGPVVELEGTIPGEQGRHRFV